MMIDTRISALAALAGLAACSQPVPPETPPPAIQAQRASPPVTAAPETRRAYFGELHLHTGYSFDAYALMGSRADPDAAYRFGRGEAVTYLGDTVRRSRPLDFMAVTDHSEYLGSFMRIDKEPQGGLAQSKGGKLMASNPLAAALGQLVSVLSGDEPTSAAMDDAMASAWQYEVDTANRYNQPGKFTTFVAYEWTTMQEGKYNLHRNVIFADEGPAAPFTATDSRRPEDLWDFLDAQRAMGIEGLAIPHNSNASGGLMFDWKKSDGRPIDEAYAQQRALNEPLVEVYQHKGQSETSPLLSPEDDFADFERSEALLTGGKGEVNGSFTRQALGRGLVLEKKLGANPFAFGFVGSSDFHNGLSDSAESAYAGNGLNSTDPEVNLPDKAFARQILSQKVDPTGAGAPAANMNRPTDPEALRHTAALLNWSSAGLTGVWAEENTRPAIYAALRRRETFATSGTQLRLRMFGGWNLPGGMMQQAGWVARAYRMGVPMGADLPLRREGNPAPTLLLEAAKDPIGANLDRLQVIKIWLDGEDYKEKVFDVVWSSERQRDPRTGKVPAVKNTVDLATAKYENSVGATVLRAQWQDPEFDPAVPAVYYARALEIPTPRWPTLLAVARGLPLPEGIAPTLQERGISSPIWYTPGKGS